MKWSVRGRKGQFVSTAKPDDPQVTKIVKEIDDMLKPPSRKPYDPKKFVKQFPEDLRIWRTMIFKEGELRGKSIGQIKGELDEANNKFRQFMLVSKLTPLMEGRVVSRNRIGELTGLAPKTLRNWAEKGYIPRVSSFEPHVNPPTTHDPDFAYFSVATFPWLGRFENPEIHTTVNDKETRDRLRAGFERYVKRKPTINDEEYEYTTRKERGKLTRYRFRILSPKYQMLRKNSSGGNAHLPHINLLEADEQLEALKALFDTHTTLSPSDRAGSSVIRITCESVPETMVDDIRLLLYNNGILSSTVKTTRKAKGPEQKNSIVISHHRDIERVIKLGLFSGSETMDYLRRLNEKFEDYYVFDWRDFNHFQELLERKEGAPFTEITAEMNSMILRREIEEDNVGEKPERIDELLEKKLSAGNARGTDLLKRGYQQLTGWRDILGRGELPTRVQAARKLEEIKEKREWGVNAILSLDMGATPEEARDFATSEKMDVFRWARRKKLPAKTAYLIAEANPTFEEIKKSSELIHERLGFPKEDIYLFTIPRERIIELIGEKMPAPKKEKKT
ncbi:MAG: hypothetical protein ABH950_06445 [Candidatus Altiarchaeota archaeon]